jgi:hypothetical protein
MGHRGEKDAGIWVGHSRLLEARRELAQNSTKFPGAARSAISTSGNTWLGAGLPRSGGLRSDDGRRRLADSQCSIARA